MAWNLSDLLRSSWLRSFKRRRHPATVFRSRFAVEVLEERAPASSLLGIGVPGAPAGGTKHAAATPNDGRSAAAITAPRTPAPAGLRGTATTAAPPASHGRAGANVAFAAPFGHHQGDDPFDDDPLADPLGAAKHGHSPGAASGGGGPSGAVGGDGGTLAGSGGAGGVVDTAPPTTSSSPTEPAVPGSDLNPLPVAVAGSGATAINPPPGAPVTRPSIPGGSSATTAVLAPTGSRSTAVHPSLARNYGNTPLPFEANVGQTDPSVRYLSHGAGFDLFVTDTSVVFSIARPSTNTSTSVSSRGQPIGNTLSDVFRMNFVGANAHPQIVGEQELQSQSNYFLGTDANQWRAGVSQYGQVVVKNLYPGIDLVFHSVAGSRQLEYDFVVNPGADPSAIRMSYTGLQGVQLGTQNSLVLRTAGGNLTQQAPVLYQTAVNGQRQVVTGGNVLQGGGQVGFQVGSYDHSRPLVIDPTIAFSTYLGGSGDDFGFGIAADSQGNTYVTGETSSDQLPNGTGPVRTVPMAFVTKLNSDGTGAVYSTYLGGDQTESGTGTAANQSNAIAVDTLGNAYITGVTTAKNFPITPPAQAPTGTVDISLPFVAKLVSVR
jgi:hypothetical protein